MSRFPCFLEDPEDGSSVSAPTPAPAQKQLFLSVEPRSPVGQSLVSLCSSAQSLPWPPQAFASVGSCLLSGPQRANLGRAGPQPVLGATRHPACGDNPVWLVCLAGRHSSLSCPGEQLLGETMQPRKGWEQPAAVQVQLGVILPPVPPPNGATGRRPRQSLRTGTVTSSSCR